MWLLLAGNQKDLAFTNRLKGRWLNIFFEAKQASGVSSNAEVIRYILTQYSKAKQEHSSTLEELEEENERLKKLLAELTDQSSTS